MAGGVRRTGQNRLQRFYPGPPPDPMETELKFQVSAASRDRLHRAVATPRVLQTRMAAVYFDTPGHELAHAGFALRLRREGRLWVQTLKGRDGLATRLEHEVPLPAARGEPPLDPALHAGSPAGDALARLLPDAALLRPVYRTEIQRWHRVVRHGGAAVEIAFDEGRIVSGDGRRARAVCEIEFELKSGPPAALVALAGRWVERFGLWWDVRPKSEQGTRLALGLAEVPAARAAPAAWPADAALPRVFSASLQAALAQALANAAEIADGAGSPEQLHQLRVGLRRLRAALRLFAPWCGEPERALQLEAAWREPFGLLGAARDADVLAQTLAPVRTEPDAPPFTEPPRPAAIDEPGIVRGPAFNTLALQTLALAMQPPASQPEPSSTAEAARAVLVPLWRAVRRDIESFPQAGPSQRHRLRKRLKRLRYGLEFLAPLFPGKQLRRFLRHVAGAGDVLGRLNDADVARGRMTAHAAEDPAAGYAAGWLAGRHGALLAEAQAALKALAKARRPWRA